MRIESHRWRIYTSVEDSSGGRFVFPPVFPYLLTMILVAVGLITRNVAPELTEILLCQRKETSRYGLKWEFPGGKVEEGEGTADGLRRELREELEIEATVGELYHRQRCVYPDSGTFDIYYYRIPSYSGAIVNHVFEATAWVSVTCLGEYDILSGNADVVGKLMNDYAKIEVGKN